MRDQLTHYVDLLFAGAPNASEIKQEILQNTLDRYDDLISQGKSPEAAYRLAISGIGDINELLSGGEEPSAPQPSPAPAAQTPPSPRPEEAKSPVWRRVLQGIAVGFYILCPIPLFVLQNELGLCGLLTLVAVGVVLQVIAGKDSPQEPSPASPRKSLRSSISAVVWSVGLCVYFILSFTTRAWFITWVIFPLIGCVNGLIHACMDLKESE